MRCLVRGSTYAIQANTVLRKRRICNLQSKKPARVTKFRNPCPETLDGLRSLARGDVTLPRMHRKSYGAWRAARVTLTRNSRKGYGRYVPDMPTIAPVHTPTLSRLASVAAVV